MNKNFLAVSYVGEGREEGTLLLKRGSVSFIVMKSKTEDMCNFELSYHILPFALVSRFSTNAYIK